jgi:hypothetical protein
MSDETRQQAEVSTAVATTVTCGAKEAWCVCRLDLDHDGPHECQDRELCDGSWDYNQETGEFVAVRLPKMGNLGAMLGGLFGFVFGGSDDDTQEYEDLANAAQGLRDAVSDDFGSLATCGWGREIIVAYLELQKLTDEYGLLPGVKGHD